jgi:hypothetical protein
MQVLALAARYTLPVIYPALEWAEAGGLMSYGSSFRLSDRAGEPAREQSCAVEIREGPPARR